MRVRHALPWGEEVRRKDSTVSTPETIRRLRGDRPQGEWGAPAGLTQRQVSRLESGDAELTLAQAVRISEAYGVSLTELAGKMPGPIDLSGDWWAAWQTLKDDIPRVDFHELRIRQDGEFLQLDGDRARSVEDGSYAWVGEARMWDSEVLLRAVP
ncbi:XRE family transcriptional regulator [Nocardia farcinica]|nr:XRE family transcriptional regulator [Nocardia farcinica]